MKLLDFLRISLTHTISEQQQSSLPALGREAQRYASDACRKISILRTRLDTLHSLLSGLPSLTKKEMIHRVDMVSKLRSKVNGMASTLNMSKFGSRDSLVGPEVKQPPDAMSRVTGLDNQGIVGLQRQIIKGYYIVLFACAEQGEDLEQLEVTIVSTKHIALAVNVELDLQKGLIEKIGEDVDDTNSKLQQIGRKVAILNKQTKGGCSLMNMLLSVVWIVVLVAFVYMLIKYF
ncbi:hypothetical protein SASPL_152647 [Salvia splendens]|uniref:t-SNARE coiled-coil homology domain-containing protein n=1 Tax=Salvia splendens TaxID=180675 RepID=A0A8X8W3F0_SALSN|nr:hypothetical protein SASPL_152647 [Salvia splendens]